MGASAIAQSLTNTLAAFSHAPASPKMAGVLV